MQIGDARRQSSRISNEALPHRKWTYVNCQLCTIMPLIAGESGAGFGSTSKCFRNVPPFFKNPYESNQLRGGQRTYGCDMSELVGAWRCLIIEDDEENANYIARELKDLGYQTKIARDGRAGMELATTASWEVIILDRMLPNEVDGLSILTALRGMGNKTPVLVLSALSALDQRVRGLKAGGDDYLTKPFAISELAARAEALIRRSSSVAESRKLEIADLSLDLASRRVERAGRLITLQPREFRLLAYFMMNPDRVLTRTMLLESVWDYRFDPQTNVIDVHVSRLRGKLEAAGERPLIHTERGTGYRMTADLQPNKKK